MMKHTLFTLCLVSLVVHASENKRDIEPVAPQAPEAPEVSVTAYKELKRVVETKKREEKREKNGKRTTPMHDVMIFLDAGDEDKKNGGAISINFASALCQQGFPIIVAEYTLKVFYSSNLGHDIVDSWKASFDWHVYKTKTGDFYLFIPKKYFQRVSAEINEDALKKQIRSTKYNPEDVLLGFRTKGMIAIEKYDQIQPQKSDDNKKQKESDSSAKINIESLKSIFVQGKDDFFGSWNIYLNGHGMFSQELVKQIQEGKFATLKPLSVKDYADVHLTGIDLNQFRELIDFCINKINTNFVMYNTCFGGGVNTVLPYVTTIANQKGNVTGVQKPNFTLVSGALTDVYTFAQIKDKWCEGCLKQKNFEECVANADKKGANGTLFFELLHKYAGDGVRPTLYNNEELEKIFSAVVYRHAITKAVYDPYGITGLPLVLFPRTDAFVAFDLGGKMGILSQVLLKKHIFEKKDISFKNKEAILVYPTDIQVQVTIETTADMPSSIVSMIPGVALHRFDSIAINTTMPMFVRAFGGGVFEKYYYIKKLQVSDDTKKQTTFHNVFIKTHMGNVDALCVSDDKKSVYHFYSEAGHITFDLSGYANSKKLTIKPSQALSDDFLNALFLYFGTDSFENKEIKSIFAYKAIVTQLLTDTEKSILEKSFKQLVEVKSEKLLQDFPNLFSKPNEQNQAGQTPLVAAVQIGDFDAVKALVHLGADINANNKDGQTPLMVAVEQKMPKIAQYLVSQKGIDITKEDSKGNSALRMAVSANDDELVALMASPALEKYMIEFPRILTHPNELSASGESPLNKAVQNIKGDHGEATKTIIQIGANINAIDKKGKAPFVELVKGPVITRYLQFFLGHGADINFQDADGVAALMAVGENKNRHSIADITEYLLNNGANIALKDKQGKTAFDYMPEPKGEYDKDLKGPLMDFALNQKKENTEFLREFFGYLTKEFPGFEKKPNAVNDAGQAPIHAAIQAGDMFAVKALAKIGADLTITDKDGNTPLMFALENEKKEIAQWLLEQKVVFDNASVENKQGQSALSIAKTKKYDEIIRRINRGFETYTYSFSF